ncbi:hypothetical protein ACFY1S_25545 [Micromonospora sp. NPDC000663]
MSQTVGWDRVVEAMVAALGEMIRSGDVDVILSKVEDGSIQLSD